MKQGAFKYFNRKMSKVDWKFRHSGATKGISNNTTSYSVGIGYIIIPTDIDRSIYMKQCYNSGRIGIMLENGDVCWDALVSAPLLNTLTFPETTTRMGSFVAYIVIPNHDERIIIADLPKIDDTPNVMPDCFLFERALGDNHVSISGNAKTSTLDITTKGSSRSKLNININSSQNKGELNINIDGNLKIVAINEASISSINKTELSSQKQLNFIVEYVKDGEKKTTQWKFTAEEGFNYVDEFENEEHITKEHHQIKPKEKFDIGEGAEPLVLGNKLKGLMEDLFSAISHLTVPTALGPSGTPVNIAEFEAVKARLNEMLSQYANTD